jgi:hypothetical protein
VCHRQAAEPVTVSAEVEAGAEAADGADEDEDQAGNWVVGEKWVRVVDRQMVSLPGWKVLWRPGNDAGPQPRIAEGAAQDVDR